MNLSLVWAFAALLTATVASEQETHKTPSPEHKAPAADTHKAPTADAQKAPADDRHKPAADPHQAGGPARTKHGIVLRREPKTPTLPKGDAGDSAKGHTSLKSVHGAAPGEHTRTNDKPESAGVTPAASPERVASALAEAIREADAKRTQSPPRPRTARSSAPHVPPRRYTLRWPSERFEVEWPEP